MAAVTLGTLLTPLNSSMVAVALVRLEGDFGVGVATAATLVTGFYLASAVAQPLMGRLADRFGPRRVFLSGLLVLLVVCGLAPLAPGFGWLVVVRVLQALGAAAAFPSGLAMIRAASPGGRAPAGALGAVNVANSTGAAFGPALAGFLVAFAGWPAIFLVNVPLAAVGIVAGLRWLPRDRPPGPQARQDLLSALRLLAATPRLAGVYLQFAGVNVVFYSIFLALPLWFQQARGLPPYEAGLLLLPVSGLSILVTPPAAWSIGRYGPRPSLAVGAAALLAGSLELLAFAPGTPIWALAAAGTVFGLPAGLNTLGLQAALYEAAPPAVIGAAAGLFQACRYIGAILSGLLISVAFGGGTTTPALHGLAAGLVVLSAGLLAVAALSRRRDRSALAAQ